PADRRQSRTGGDPAAGSDDLILAGRGPTRRDRYVAWPDPAQVEGRLRGTGRERTGWRIGLRQGGGRDAEAQRHDRGGNRSHPWFSLHAVRRPEHFNGRACGWRVGPRPASTSRVKTLGALPRDFF